LGESERTSLPHSTDDQLAISVDGELSEAMFT
jgi:hypothetical protein